jgi:alpha-ketoglutarate-dependent taurine dioxygenase
MATATSPIAITPLHPTLGAEIAGVDLSRPVDGATRAALGQALADHLALVFRNQTLTEDQYLEAASIFGPPMEQHYSQHNMPDHPLIGLIWHRNGLEPGEAWHADHTNRERPPAATSTHGAPAASGRAVSADATSQRHSSAIAAHAIASWTRAGLAIALPPPPGSMRDAE